MLYQGVIMLHLLGASIWIGGHAVLVAAVLPGALRRNEPDRVVEFERGYGRLGLSALVVQLLTGFWLADCWIGDWTRVFTEPTVQSHLVLSKLTVLALTLALAGYAYHAVLPKIGQGRLGRFALLAGVTTALSVVMLILGVGIRTGGLRP